jgi:hypothetical protein
VRADIEARIKNAETARAFAWRRLNMLSDMARIATAETDREVAVERQLVALFREIGWIEVDWASSVKAPSRWSTAFDRSPGAACPGHPRLPTAALSRRIPRWTR